MSAPVLLPGDWVYITFGYPHNSSMSVRAHYDAVIEEGGKFTKIFNSMGVNVVGYSGNSQMVGMKVDVVFRNDIAPVEGRAPGL